MKPILILAVSLLFGCAPATIQGLRDSPSGKLTFQVDQNYQAVYRAAIERARTCYQTGMITAQMNVQGDLFTDIRSGNITVALHGGLGVDTHMTIDIAAIDDRNTKVDTFYALGTWRSNARAVEGWVKTKSTECSTKS